MAGQFKEIFTNTAIGVGPQSENKQRKFDVWDVATKEAAVGTVNIYFNDEHPNDDTMKVSNISPTQTGFQQFTVVYDYSRPENGATHVPPKPEDRIPSVRWDFDYVDLEIDSDVDGRPILNAAGDGFQTAPTRKFRVVTLVLKWWSTSFPWATYSDYRNAVNNANWSLGGATIPAHMAQCLAFGPSQEFAIDAVAIQMQAAFQIWDGGLLRYPWQLRLPNVGYNAWGQPKDANGNNVGNPVRGIICDKFGNTIQDSIPLDLDGKPVDTSAGYAVKIGACIYPICNSSSPVTWFDSDSYTIGTGQTARTYYYLYFQRYREISFSPIAGIVGISGSGGPIVGG